MGNVENVETESRKLSNDVDDCPNSLQKILWLYTQAHADTRTHRHTDTNYTLERVINLRD